LLDLVKYAEVARLRLSNGYTCMIYVSMKQQRGFARSPIAWRRYLLQIFTYHTSCELPIAKIEVLVDYLKFGVSYNDEKVYIKSINCSLGYRT